MNALDYGIWSPLKRKVQGPFGCPLEKLEASLIHHWDRVATPTFVRHLTSKLRRCLMTIIALGGAYYEKKWCNVYHY